MQWHWEHFVVVVVACIPICFVLIWPNDSCDRERKKERLRKYSLLSQKHTHTHKTVYISHSNWWGYCFFVNEYLYESALSALFLFLLNFHSFGWANADLRCAPAFHIFHINRIRCDRVHESGRARTANERIIAWILFLSSSMGAYGNRVLDSRSIWFECYSIYVTSHYNLHRFYWQISMTNVLRTSWWLSAYFSVVVFFFLRNPV